MDLDLKLHHPHIGNRKHSKSNSAIHHENQVCFQSYGDSLRQLSSNISVTDKDKYLRFFDFFTQQKSESHMKNQSFIKDQRKSSISSYKKGKSKTRENNKLHENFINQVKDQSDNSNLNNDISNLVQQANEQQAQFQVKQFTHEERQSLKNAFRYICRLVFKQAHKYSDKMSELFLNKNNSVNPNNSHLNEQKHHVKKSRRQKSSLSSLSVNNHGTLSQLNLLQQAQLISGQRYFKQYLQKLQTSQRKILLNYMIWFLKTKYLRYINKCNNENKGKRKQMKKDLYIRFKNNTMLPYLQALLEETKV